MSVLRKTDSADLKRRYPLYIEVGLLISLGLLVVAFNVQWMPEDSFEIENEEQETVEMKQIEQTQQIEKPPPPPEPQVPVEVPNDETTEDASIELSAELDMNTNQNQQQPPPPPEEEEENTEPEVFMAVEQMPEPIGGTEAIYSNVTYPEMARKAGIEGRVVVNFVVDEEGAVTQTRVVRSLGAACDEAAVKAIEATEFRAGKQRGKPVKVRMQQQIVFRLN